MCACKDLPLTTRPLLASAATAVALTLTLPALATDKAQDFVDKAAAGGMFEVNSSKIAEGKTQNGSVKDFAQKMIDDHSAANAKMKTVAEKQKLQVPADAGAEHEGDLASLKNAKDPIDGIYISMQRDAHAEAVKLFESYAVDGDNEQLKAFAQETLPALKMHQEMVEKIAAAMENDSASTTPTATTEPADNAPVPGANSFTEDQAKSRIQDAGYSEVSALTKDDQGIWRGQASKDGKSTAVALDYQGNVVAEAN